MNRGKERQAENVIQMGVGQKNLCVETMGGTLAEAQAVAKLPDTGSGVKNYQTVLIR